MTTLIKNATIIDGTGKPEYKGDIFIKNDVISAMGDLGRQSADKVINAVGMYATPGFIDVNASSDHYLTLFTNPTQSNFLLQGVTTIFGGMCGSSLAPLLYGELVSIRKWANDESAINVDWKTVGELLRSLGRLHLGINFGTLVGHSTVRRALIGEALRDLTDNELAVFEQALFHSLREGAFGLSTGLSYAHSSGTPHYELKRLAETVSLQKGLYATHLRNERRGLVDSIKETIALAKETGTRTLINHLRPIKGYEAEYSEGVELINQAAGDAKIYFDLYPFEMSHVSVYTLLPDWARNGGLEVMLKNLKQKPVRDQILSDIHIKDGNDIIIAGAPHVKYLEGKTLGEFSEKREVSLGEGLLLLMELTSLKSTVYYKDIDYELVKKTLPHPEALVSSNSPGSEASKDISGRSTKTFTKFLSLVHDENLMDLPQAIQKITATPAKLFGLVDRGALKEGMKADINALSFDSNAGAVIHHVFVNGAQAVENKEFKNGNAGEVLRHK